LKSLNNINWFKVNNSYSYKLLLFFCCFFILLTTTTGNLTAAALEEQDEYRISRERYLKNFYLIPADTLGGIAEAEETLIKQNFLAGGFVFAGLAFDQLIRDYFQEEIYRGSSPFSRFLYNIGTIEYAAPGFVLLYLSSRLAEDIYLENTLLYSAQSLIITAIITEVVKNIVRRERPRYSSEDHLVRGEGDSFFSGHASAAWAVLTVVAERYSELKIPAYSLAGAVSLARIYEDAHWFTDVLAGSLVGYGIARITGEYYQKDKSGISLRPLVETSRVGFLLTAEF